MFNRDVLLSFIFLFLSSFTWGEAGEDYVHGSSESLRRIELKNGYELAYGLKAFYPAENIIGWYEDELSKDGYARCRSPIPEWQSYSDRSVGGRIKFDRNAAWLNKSQKTLVVLVLTYFGGDRSQPDNSDLSISLQVIKLQSENEVSEALSSLDIGDCS